MELNEIKELLGENYGLSATFFDRYEFVTSGCFEGETAKKLLDANLEFDVWIEEYQQLCLTIKIQQPTP